jgi:hypothetical protein
LWAASLIILTMLLSAGTALAQSGEQGSSTAYAIESSTISGAGYHLSSLSWHVSGLAGGGAYSLVVADRAAGGNQCCCAFLPLILRSYQ